MEQKQIRKGKYTFKVIPKNKKSWNEAEDLEAVFLLETEKETKSFKGNLTLFGIVKK